MRRKGSFRSSSIWNEQNRKKLEISTLENKLYDFLLTIRMKLGLWSATRNLSWGQLSYRWLWFLLNWKWTLPTGSGSLHYYSSDTISLGTIGPPAILWSNSEKPGVIVVRSLSRGFLSLQKSSGFCFMYQHPGKYLELFEMELTALRETADVMFSIMTFVASVERYFVYRFL